MAIGQEIGTKLSAKSFGWDSTSIMEAVLKNKEQDVPLYRVGGVATGLRKYKSAYEESGEGFGLSGQFKGIGADGTEKAGSVLYLPKNVHEMVEAALSLGDDVAGVRIGFDIYARYDAKAATKYVFAARDILNEGSSSLDSVMNVLADLPALGAPETKQIENKSK